MNIEPIQLSEEPEAKTIEFTDTMLVVHLVDGRVLSIPLTWFPSLLNASAAQRGNWRLIGDGEGINWPDLDEDLSVRGFLAGNRPY